MLCKLEFASEVEIPEEVEAACTLQLALTDTDAWGRGTAELDGVESRTDFALSDALDVEPIFDETEVTDIETEVVVEVSDSLNTSSALSQVSS